MEAPAAATPAHSEDVFISLLQLYRNKTDISTLATAIERHGIQGWDRFGRLKTFKDEQGEYKAALDALAALYAWESDFDNIQATEMSPIDAADGLPYSIFDMGWPADQVPDFDKIKLETRSGELERPESSKVRNQRRYQRCVDAGLVMPNNDYARLPDGIKVLAEREGISVTAMSNSIKKHIATFKK